MIVVLFALRMLRMTGGFSLRKGEKAIAPERGYTASDGPKKTSPFVVSALLLPRSVHIPSQAIDSFVVGAGWTLGLSRGSIRTRRMEGEG